MLFLYNIPRILKPLILSCFIFSFAPAPDQSLQAKEIDFSKNILPVLSNNCFGCHGPDEAKRKAGLRLDKAEGAKATLKSGSIGLVPGNISESAIYQRITSEDPEEVMPPADSGKKLTKEETDRIKDWIKSGGEWGKHWSFEKPVKSKVLHD